MSLQIRTGTLEGLSRERRIYDEWRVRQLCLSPRNLIAVLQSDPGTVIKLVEGLPADAYVLNVGVDAERNCIVLLVGSMTYDPVPEALRPESVNIAFATEHES